jgi:hypothetical protein
LTIKLTQHVAAARLLREGSVRIIRLSTIRSLEQNLRTKRVAARPDGDQREMLRVFASFFSCQRASALATTQSVPRPAERSKNFRTENKKPGVERRANPPAHKTQAASRDARLSIIRYS